MAKHSGHLFDSMDTVPIAQSCQCAVCFGNEQLWSSLQIQTSPNSKFCWDGMYIITKGPRNMNTILVHTYTFKGELKGEKKNPQQKVKGWFLLSICWNLTIHF